MKWTRLDVVLLSIPLVVIAVALGYRAYVVSALIGDASEVRENIELIAAAVANYHENTGDYFPQDESRDDYGHVYLNPFDLDARVFQGMQEDWLYIQNNSGLVLQLVRFDPAMDRVSVAHTFEQSYRTGEPYLRILIDYGERQSEEMKVISLVEERLPQGSFAEIDSHYHVVDLRRLIEVINGES